MRVKLANLSDRRSWREHEVPDDGSPVVLGLAAGHYALSVDADALIQLGAAFSDGVGGLQVRPDVPVSFSTAGDVSLYVVKAMPRPTPPYEHQAVLDRVVDLMTDLAPDEQSALLMRVADHLEVKIKNHLPQYDDWNEET